MTSVTIPNGVTSIGDGAFSLCNIKSIEFNAKACETCCKFPSTLESLTIGGCGDLYTNQSPWNLFTIIEDLENTSNNEDGIISVAAHPVLITTEGSTIRVKGLVNTKEVRYATTDGKLLGASRVIDGESLFDTRMPAGTIVIVSTDGGSAKTMLR